MGQQSTEAQTASDTWTPRRPSWIWLDGRFVAPDDARVSLLAHGLHYGTGVFEGIRSYATANGPRIFALGAHLERLRRGAELLGLTVDVESLAWVCQETLERNGLDDAYLRPLVFHGAGSLALDLGPQAQHTAVAAMPWRSHLGGEASVHGVRATFSSLRRNAARAIPPLKLTGGYVNAILAKRAAGAAGFDEAIFCDEHERVCEATGENVFAVIGGEVIAVAHPDALPGITRAAILDLAGGAEGPLTRAELLAADEVFLTGTSAEVTPVRELDGTRFAIGPVTRELQRAYADLVRERRGTRAPLQRAASERQAARTRPSEADLSRTVPARVGEAKPARGRGSAAEALRAVAGGATR